jgi:carbonic anhydrase/acetyltransferase-like protein (isoleucine patch superfamily)
MTLYALGDWVPDIDPTAFVHPDAVIIGKVRIGAESSVWPHAVLRGDNAAGIWIGDRSSIQDGTVVHATHVLPTIVGDDCVIGHLAHLEGCTVEDGALVGSGAVVLHRAVIGTGALVGAGAVVPDDMSVPAETTAFGVPAKVREGASRRPHIERGVQEYLAKGKRYRAELRRID